MKNKKGFTLIELLAVIVILGLLMAIAIPSVTRYITQSRMKTLTSSIDSFISSATNKVNNNDFGALSDNSTLFYIPVSNDETKSCVELEKGGSDPFGDWTEAYVVVHYVPDKFSYDYYFTFYDSAGYYMKLTESKNIRPSGADIQSGAGTFSSTITKQKAVGSTDITGVTQIKKLKATACTVESAESVDLGA